MAFQDHYPLDAFKDGYAAGKTGQGGADDHKETVFFPAVKAHLLALRAEGRLGAATGLAGRDVWIASDWNAMVETGEFSRWLVSAITGQAFHGSHFDADREAPVLTSEQKLWNAWADLCILLDRGTSTFRFTLDACDDGKTGERCRLQFEDWKAELGVWNGREFEAARDAAIIPLSSIEIDCPSGEIIFTDCLSLGDGAFHDALDLGERRFRDASVNSEQGRIVYSSLIAEQYGVAEICTSNTAVAVHVDDDRILVSERWGDDSPGSDDIDGDILVPGWKKAGTFSCDRWMVVAVDRHVAADILERKGVAKPSIAIDKWLDEEEDEAVVVRVAPGRYRIDFGDRYHERVDRSQAGIPAGPEPWLLMQRIA